MFVASILAAPRVQAASRLGVLALLLSVSGSLAWQEEKKPSADAAERLKRPSIPVQSLLAATERYMRPSARQDLAILYGELNARGFDAAARRLKDQITTTDVEFERLIADLLANRAIGAAQELLRDWQRRFPKSSARQLAYSGFCHFASGEYELCRRELERVDSTNLPPALANAVSLAKRMCLAESRGIRVGSDGNPWQVDFGGPSRKFEAAKLDRMELKKLDPAAAEQSAALLAIVPLQGNLWALHGELLNAAGDVGGAIASIRRAESLGYTPRKLLERRKILEDYAREQQANATANSTPGGNSQSSSTSAIANNAAAPQNDSANSGSGWIVGIGAIIVAAIAALQVREWLRAANRK